MIEAGMVKRRHLHPGQEISNLSQGAGPILSKHNSHCLALIARLQGRILALLTNWPEPFFEKEGAIFSNVSSPT